MEKIDLGNKKYAIVDIDDLPYLNQWKWGFDGKYARRRENGKKIYMHRLINNTPLGLQTDHINRDKLDNRRSNLRTVSSKENIINTKVRSTNKSGHKGVWFWKSRNKWEASITNNYKKIYLGIFKKIKDAIKVRIEAEKLYWNK